MSTKDRATHGEKLSLWTKIGFGLGDIYGGGATIIVGFYYLYFLTDIVKLNPSYAGIVFLLSKGWDAVSDPLMGIISDRTRTRFGRRRPYLLAGIVLVFLSFFMMWYPVDFDRELHRFVFVLVGYIFFSTVLTMVMIPYQALSSELTLDYDERTSLMSVRIFFSSVSSIVCAVAPLEIVKLFPDVHDGYVAMAASFGLFFALPFIATFFATSERKDFKPVSEPLSFKRMFVEPFRVKSFINVLLMYLFAFVAIDAVMSIVIYFMTYYLGRGDETNYVLGALLIMQILVIPAYYVLSKKTSKRFGYILAAVLWIGTMLLSLGIRPGMHPWIIYVFAGCIGISTGGVVVMIYSIIPDIPDVDELHTGQRREGIYSGLITFMRKLSSAVAIFLISNAISITGYRPPAEETIDGVTKMVQQQQSTEFILVLRVIFAAIPILFLVMCIYNAWRYPLSPQRHATLKELLDVKRKGEDLEGDLKERERKLKEELIGG